MEFSSLMPSLVRRELEEFKVFKEFKK